MSDRERLQGTWQAVAMATADGPLPADAAGRVRYVFDGDRVTLVEDGNPVGIGVMTLGGGSAPAAIDVTMDGGPAAGQTALGVFAVEGDRLTLCIGPDRPAGFDPAGAAALVELVRVRNP